MPSVYDFTATRINGQPQSLADYRGQVLLLVNVASRCGFTPQYTGLETLYRNYHDKGFSVLGFPCDQFGNQEPGGADEIKNFCRLTYDVTFPLFEKIEVNGPDADPLFKFLKARCPGLLGTKRIKWNFTKFLIDRNGNVVRRYAPMVKPEKLSLTVGKLLREAKHD
jgi:glutathione peroxidase